MSACEYCDQFDPDEALTRARAEFHDHYWPADSGEPNIYSELAMLSGVVELLLAAHQGKPAKVKERTT